MKTFLTIRSNLLLINLVVIGLILWLAISFLHIAATQRQEAMLLQGSMGTEMAISQASHVLTLESHRFSNFLNSTARKSPDHHEQLKMAIFETDIRLDFMQGHIASLVSRQGFDSNIPATLWSLSNRLDRLDLHRKQLCSNGKRRLTRSGTLTSGCPKYSQSSSMLIHGCRKI